MIKDFKLPDLGEGLTESEILDWKVSVGDSVTLNQTIAEVETAKAVVELPSPYAGVVTAIHFAPGATVEVGVPIIAFDLGDTGASASGAADAAEPAAEPAAQRVPTLVGYGAEVEKGGRPTRRARISTSSSHGANPVVEPVETRPAELGLPQAPSTERPRSTPPVRKLAKDLGVDLTMLTGTGVGGLIVRDDVLRVRSGSAETVSAANPATASGAPSSGATTSERETRTPIKGVRKHMAAAMVQSAFTAPHVTEFLTVDVTASMELLTKLKSSRAFAGYKLGPLTLVAKAMCLAVPRQPSLNSRWDEANAEIVTMNYVNLGIAAATPRGLTVPNIKDAQSLSLQELSAALTELTETARAGKTSPADLSGGTISITNIGVFGIDAGTPILNPGEAAILAMGSVRRQPWEYQGEVALRQVMTLSLSFDHRLVDGEAGSKFLADIGAILQDPSMVLTMV